MGREREKEKKRQNGGGRGSLGRALGVQGWGVIFTEPKPKLELAIIRRMGFQVRQPNISLLALLLYQPPVWS